MRLLRRKRFWLFVATIAVITLISVLFLKGWFINLRSWLRTLGPWSIPMFIAVYVLMTLAGLPNALLMLGSGTLFGFSKGVLYASIADILGATACYVVGKTIARKQIKKWLAKNPKFLEIDKAIARKGWKIILLTRLSPVLPSSVLNYGFSCTKVKFRDYFIFTWIGMLPVIAFYVYLGSFGFRMMGREGSPQSLLLQLSGLLATVATAIYTTRVAKRALAQAEDAA
ncbi:TVP38/TMEM64 family protein [Trichocoleus desertorum AS-A10]|uniref:TVP38/TMEM64 family protein n=1 Tax=Trichocoleus desertorum TaxID=1481672 RepID=UPI003297B32A